MTTDEFENRKLRSNSISENRSLAEDEEGRLIDELSKLPNWTNKCLVDCPNHGNELHTLDEIEVSDEGALLGVGSSASVCLLCGGVFE